MSLSLVLCDKFGSVLYDWFGPAHGHSIAHGWFCALWFGFGFTLLAVFFVPFLPDLGQKRRCKNRFRQWELNSVKRGILRYHIQKEVSTIGS